LLIPEGEWRASEPEPVNRFVKSFRITPLCNPPGMFSREYMAGLWAECRDIEKGRLRDKEKYRLFRNTKQGLAFEEGGVQIEYERMIRFRRAGFVSGKRRTTPPPRKREARFCLCAVPRTRGTVACLWM
jgi:hypothetical protein